MSPSVSRRAFLSGSCALIVGFVLLGNIAEAQTGSGEGAPGSRAANPAVDPKQVDSWLRVGADDTVTIFNGKIELGTGTRTALAQIAADELYLPFESISVVSGDTERAPDEGYTAGSKTVQVGGVNVRKAAAEARQALLEMASARLGASQDQLIIDAGVISLKADPSQRVSYGELIGGQTIKSTV